MTDHLDEGRLQALLDGELSEEEVKTAEAHLASCERCGVELAVLREGSLVLTAALSLLDDPRGEARVGAFVPPAARRSGRNAALALPRAAAILLIGVAAAAAAMPGSPVREWIERRDEVTAVPVDSGSGEEFEVSGSGTGDSPRAGVSVEPAAGHLRIVLIRPSPDLRIRATITDSPRGGAYATGRSVNARFSTGLGVVEVIDASGGELLLEIPARATSATVELDGETYLEKDGGQLRLLVASGDSSGTEVIFQPR